MIITIVFSFSKEAALMVSDPEDFLGEKVKTYAVTTLDRVFQETVNAATEEGQDPALALLKKSDVALWEVRSAVNNMFVELGVKWLTCSIDFENSSTVHIHIGSNYYGPISTEIH